MRIERINTGTSPFDRSLTIEFDSNSKSTFDWIFLRDNCLCKECIHPETKQRIFDTFNSLPFETVRDKDGTIQIINDHHSKVRFECNNDTLVSLWQDGHISHFPEKWLLTHSYAPQLYKDIHILPSKISWDSTSFLQLKADNFRNSYTQIEKNLPRVLHEIYTYGFSFVQDVPVTLEATRQVSELISIIRPTHYDLGVWDFTSDLSKKDTAYTSLVIDMHTDGNYWYELPGLQLFHLLEHSNGEGGETRIVDICKIVDVLISLSKKDRSWKTTLEVLTKQPISFHQAGETDTCFQQDSYPTLTLDKQSKLVQCRWNTSDRSPKISNQSGFLVHQVYEALFRFNALINDPKYYVQFQLKPGTILVFDNWRILHARTAFTGHRRLCGSYLTRDDFLARLRSLSCERSQLLNNL